MLIWVASYPRSGNTLTMLVLRDVFGIHELGRVVAEDLSLGQFAERLSRHGGKRTFDSPPPELQGLGKVELLDAIRKRPEPFFIRTHRLREAANSDPALYIVRDGRDALVSHAHIIGDRPKTKNPHLTPPELRELREAEDRYRDLPYSRRLAKLIDPGIPGYGDWSDNVRVWRTRAAPTAVVRFEDLVAKPAQTVRRACKRLEVPLPARTGRVVRFAALHRDNPRMFRRGVIGAYRDEMAPSLKEQFWLAHGHEMRAMGYQRDPDPSSHPDECDSDR